MWIGVSDSIDGDRRDLSTQIEVVVASHYILCIPWIMQFLHSGICIEEQPYFTSGALKGENIIPTYIVLSNRESGPKFLHRNFLLSSTLEEKRNTIMDVVPLHRRCVY